MCMGIYFVDKAVVQHYSVSKMLAAVRQLKKQVQKELKFVCMTDWLCSRNVICPTFFPSADKINLLIKIHINRGIRLFYGLFVWWTETGERDTIC